MGASTLSSCDRRAGGRGAAREGGAREGARPQLPACTAPSTHAHARTDAHARALVRLRLRARAAPTISATMSSRPLTSSSVTSMYCGFITLTASSCGGRRQAGWRGGRARGRRGARPGGGRCCCRAPTAAPRRRRTSSYSLSLSERPRRLAIACARFLACGSAGGRSGLSCLPAGGCGVVAGRQRRRGPAWRRPRSPRRAARGRGPGT